MKNQIKKYITVVVFFILAFGVFFSIDYRMKTKSTKVSNLVIFGDNIKTSYNPFVENGGIYVSVDTIKKVIDEHIYYDKVATKVIITTKNELIKFKVDENKMSRNFEYSDILTCAKSIDGQPYIDISLLKDVYNINVEYNDKANTVSIDKKGTNDLPVKYNGVYVYSDLNTKSQILETLGKKNTVTVYTESLVHNRWYKVKTDSGVVGYIAKNNVDVVTENKNGDTSNNENSENNENQSKEKLVMFWQYGSNLSTLGTSKINPVNVVSPTWYELANSSGKINSKFNKEYYNQAKKMGYKIWPIITNGIDSVSYTSADTSAMLNSEYNREQFIKNLLKICKDDGIDGINVDFEAMRTEDKDMYTQLIRELAPILRSNNIIVSVDMYFVAYIDRKDIGEASDYVVLMGYDQRGAWSNEPGSISEISWVEKNVNSLINDSNIPSDKIILGVPFYTRLWTVKPGESKPTTTVYTIKNCKEYIEENNLTPIWDENAGQNYVEMKKGSVTYKLWIEDSASMKKRVETVNKFNLAGITGWRKGFETDDIWQTIKENL